MNAIIRFLFVLSAGMMTLAGCSFRHLVYYPDPKIYARAADLNRPYQDVYFQPSDGMRLNGWFLPVSTNFLARPVVLFCHGNAGNISHRLPQYQAILDTGASVFAFDYRGYGRSGGQPTEAGTYRDAQAAYAWLRQQGFAAHQVVVLGESLGGGVAAELAVREPVSGLVLQSTFTSIPDVAQHATWLPVQWLVSTRYNTHKKLPELKVPVLVMHSRADTVIPFSHAQRNFAAANEPKFFWELAGDHNETLQASRERYQEGIRRFLIEVDKRAGSDQHPVSE